MELKIDKETLIKQRFWVLLGVFVPLVLVAMVRLWTSVASANQKARADKDKKFKELKDDKQRTMKDFEQLEAVLSKVAGRKNTMWRTRPWETQKDLMQWPEGLQPNSAVCISATKSLPNPATSFTGRKIIRPGRPGALPGPTHAGFQPGGRAAGEVGKVSPSSEDLWLAEEDLWVQWELLKALTGSHFLHRAVQPRGARQTRQDQGGNRPQAFPEPVLGGGPSPGPPGQEVRL